MPGGQKGLSFVGEPMVFAIVATFVITILVQLQLGCLGDGNPSAGSELEEKCEAAYVVENDGDDETVNETAILEQSDCRAHIASMQAQWARERSEEVQP